MRELVLAIAVAIVSSIANATVIRRYVADDFYIDTVHGNSEPFEARNSMSKESESTNCRDNIKQILCIVAPPKPEMLGQQQICEPGGESYAPTFEALYDAYPPVLQKMFCSLKVINIEQQFFGTAYAGLVKDKAGKILGAEMGIRKSVLDEGLNLRTWASWKEQLSFGGVKESYTVTPGLPLIETSSKEIGASDFLYFVVAHEFGHMLDFSNQLNRTLNCPDLPVTFAIEDTECLMAAESWGGISWISDREAKPENEFPHRTELCFYGCEGKFIAPSAIGDLYSKLYESEFISIYASTQPWDDFADSLAYFLMNRNLDTQYVIKTSKGHTFDIMEKVRSQRWAKKYEYINQLINKTDLVYP